MDEKILKECYPGVYRVRLSCPDTDETRAGAINIYIIKGHAKERSLMLDTGFKFPVCFKKLESALFELKIPYERLDIFMTHKHADHYGLAADLADLGACIYMNPEEEFHDGENRYFCHDPSSREAQERVLASFGISPLKTPDLFGMYRAFPGHEALKTSWTYGLRDFPFIPVYPGQKFPCGGYSFEAVLLRGHTFGQMGLVCRSRQLFFCGDQLIDGVSPIVPSLSADEHRLKQYFACLNLLCRDYRDYLFFPAHGESFSDCVRVAGAIRSSYTHKLALLVNLLRACDKSVDTLKAASLLYGIRHAPANFNELATLQLILTKTFSLLEYLHDTGKLVRRQENGVFQWAAAQPQN